MNEWINANEKLPPGNKEVLCFTKRIRGLFDEENYVNDFFVAYFENEAWIDLRNYDDTDVDYWMFIPEPPKE